MYPHERSLVKRLEGRQFALLGVNSDPKDTLRKAMKQENITWRSWWDGGSTEGPIQTQWNIRGWPTTYVLDQKGVIRFRDVRDEGMDKVVDQLLYEMQKK